MGFRQVISTRVSMKRSLSREELHEPSASGTHDHTIPSTKRKAGAGAGHWAMKLLDSMENPNMVVRSDELTVIIKDAYPKAKHHYLVLPRENIPNFKALNISHIDLIEHMLTFGKKLIKDLRGANSSLNFRCGYHALPSMARLHMHVISQEFDSPFLKTKKHWNSFTSNFFIDAETIIGMLRTNGRVDFQRDKYEAMLKLPLKCHTCGKQLANMPRLKEHIKLH